MEQNKKHYSIKAKLISATAMLLVATIMVVSSTYAWFTLSTAPEVTGVSTAVGANGALEMLLATKDANGEWIYGNGQVTGSADRNTYWGNLVDLSDGAKYGTNAITLFPSTINLNGGKLSLTSPLKTPVYGADGRVEGLADNVSFGKYSGTAFVPGTDIEGFRGLGVISGLTERQQGFRAALSAMATAQYNAQTAARNSLSTNGTPLANIAIMKAMNNATDKIFDDEDVAAIGSMITGVESALMQAETAYIEAIVAYVLSSQVAHANDDAALAAAAAIRTAANISDPALNERLTAVFAALETQIGAGTTAAVQGSLNGYSTYTTAVTNAGTAKTAYEAIDKTAGEYSWDDINDSLTPLVNVSVIKVNDITASEVNTEENKNKIASDILGSKGVWVDIPTGGGVYADLADLAGNYDVDIEINSDNLANGMVSGLIIKAKMKTISSVSPAHLSVVNTAISNTMPGGDAAGARPLTELYGYVIDLAFRTNAAQSNLLLQTEATDRIYDDNNNSETMGSGSTMTFKSSDVTFTTDKVTSLMSNIRVVFYDTTATGFADIYATAKLDTANATIDANGITAKLYLYENATATKASYDNGTETVQLYKYDDKYYNSTLIMDSNLVTIPEGTTVTDSTETVAVEVRDNVITSLDQGVTKHISALVYLEGETIQNSDVAATVAQSMTGTVNFPFASSANLVPMEYGNLHTPQN